MQTHSPSATRPGWTASSSTDEETTVDTGKDLWLLLKTAVRAWQEDYAQSMGAALAYYTVFAIAPLLLIVMAIAGLVFGPDAARGEVARQLNGLLGYDGAHTVQSLLDGVNASGEAFGGALVGLILLLVTATTVFSELQNALDRIWRAPAPPDERVWWNLVRSRLLSFAMVLGIGAMLIVSVILSTGLSAIGDRWSPLFGAWEMTVHIANNCFNFLLTTCLFAMVYKIMPRVHIRWGEVWMGALLTSMLFTVGKLAIGLYLRKSAITTGLGATGSVVALLVWVYYSAQIFLMGAEMTWAYSNLFGSRKPADSRPEGAPAQPALL